MADDDLQALYRRFVAIYANSEPIRGIHDLAAAVRAAGLAYDEATEPWLRSLSSKWVHGESNAPFEDESINRKYRRFLEGHTT